MLFTRGTATLIANVESIMNRRSFLSALIAAPGLAAALVACGDPDRASVATEPSTPGTTPGTTPVTEPGTTPANGITHPTGADA